MKRKISILFAICLLCALASGCSGEKSVSKVELPAVVPESPAQESVTPESTAQDYQSRIILPLRRRMWS